MWIRKVKEKTVFLENEAILNAVGKSRTMKPLTYPWPCCKCGSMEITVTLARTVALEW